MDSMSNMPPESSFLWHIGREKKKSLSPSQKGFVFANHDKYTIQEMATRLGKSYTAVSHFVEKYRLTTKTQHRNGNKK